MEREQLEEIARRLEHHHPGKAIYRILAEARERLGMDVAFVSEFRDGARVFRYVEGDIESAQIEPGGSDPLEASYCGRIVAGKAPQLMPDAQLEPSVADLPVTKDMNIRAHASVPIVFSDGHVHGTFCCFSQKAGADLEDSHLKMMQTMAALVVDQLEIETMEVRQRQAALARVSSVIATDRLRCVYQPVVRLSDRSPVFVEGLARFDVDPIRAPDRWFEEAWSCGLGVALELEAVRTALSALLVLPEEMKVSFNISPETALDGGLRKTIDLFDSNRVIVEITEHAHIVESELLVRALSRIKTKGVTLAIDDVGSGYSGLRRILDVAPDVVKLDISITKNIDADKGRRSLVTAIARFAEETGLQTVAEGIETEAQAACLTELGIPFGQGFLFGRPLPLSDLNI